MANDFQGPSKTGAYDARRTDNDFRKRQEQQRIDSLTPDQKQIEDLNARVADLERKIQIQFACGEGIDITGNAPSFSANNTALPGANGNAPFTGYAWINSVYDAVNFVWAVIFGKGTSSFAGAAQPIKQLEIVAGTPAADATAIRLVVGDAIPANDLLQLGGSKNNFKFSWWEGPEVFLFFDDGVTPNSAYFGVTGGVPTLTMGPFVGDSLLMSPIAGAGHLTFQKITLMSGETFYAFNP